MSSAIKRDERNRELIGVVDGIQIYLPDGYDMVESGDSKHPTWMYRMCARATNMAFEEFMKLSSTVILKIMARIGEAHQKL